MNPLKYLIIVPVRVYQKLVSPLLPPTCCYQPTCSHYMVEAVHEWGVLKGLWLGVRRIFSCHPWAEGGEDPVPRRKLGN